MQKKLSIQSQNYYSQDFKNLFRYIKTLNMLNQLYLSQALTQADFQQQQKDILSRYHKIKSALKNTDFQRFTQLYGIQAEYKRIQAQPNKNQQQKKIIQVSVLLSSKITQLFDTLHLGNTVMNLINIVVDIDMLSQKLKNNLKNINSEFIKCIQKVSQIKQNMKKKSIHQDLSSIQAFQLEDTITKLKIHFEQYFSR